MKGRVEEGSYASRESRHGASLFHVGKEGSFCFVTLREAFIKFLICLHAFPASRSRRRSLDDVDPAHATETVYY